LVAVILLVAAAILAGPVARRLNLKEGKKALPLRAPLSGLDERAIAPYRVKARHLLDPAIVEALGTDRYIEWSLEDTSVPPGAPLREANLFVTYYSGGHHLVPHTPDVCYLGGGYVQAQPHEITEFEVATRGSPSRVPVRVCTFAQTEVFDHREFSVVYTFHCNGQFVATRTGVRLLINDPRNTYLYFSKIEVNFPGATRAQAVEGAGKLFEVVLPVLVRDHWPDFEAEERAANRQAAGGRPLRP
jgi:hypothetical protein